MKRFPLINEMTDFDAIILADGEFPVATEPLTLLRRLLLSVLATGPQFTILQQMSLSVMAILCQKSSGIV